MLCAAILVCVLMLIPVLARGPGAQAVSLASDGYIKWVDFKVTAEAMEKALAYDIQSQNTENELNWVELLAYLGAKYGGNYKRYKARDMDALVKSLNNGKTLAELTADMPYYPYYREAYGAVLDGMVGSFEIQTPESLDSSKAEFDKRYGLKSYSPIAYGYSYAHYDDFGNSRSFGYTRTHLGNDLMGSIGTPIIAVESGVVETMGWNRYGGWRVGIRSLDGRRYYYYAHMRKDRPYQADLQEGMVIEAGDVIGYLGMTGYSDKENVNGMTVPHLHFGMQLIFDESQKDGANEIWIDVYELVNFLEHHKSPILREEETRECYRKYEFIDPAVTALGDTIPVFPKDKSEETQTE